MAGDERYAGLDVLGSFLHRDDTLLIHGGDNSDGDVFAFVKHALDLLAELSLGKPEVILRFTIRKKKAHKAIVVTGKQLRTP